jgi:hypothetical protein
MAMTFRLAWCAFCIAWAWGAMPAPAPADQENGRTLPSSRAAASILENGGFEIWRDLPPDVARQDSVKSIQLVPPGLAPAGWLPCREAYKKLRPTATIARDEKVSHGARCSVRIENRDMRDIAYVQYSTERLAGKPGDPHNIRPNRRYALRWWVKGENVDVAGTGPILMMHVLSMHDGKPQRDDTYEQSPLPKGTFDWQAREHRFVTGPDARWIVLTLQLRWTTGTIWYDDVELVDLGEFVQVETY